MIFWIGIIIAFCCTAVAVKRGFYETCCIFFNLLIAVFLAVVATPFFIKVVPGIAETAYSSVITMLIVAVSSFVILYVVAFVMMIGQFTINMPKFFDVLAAGILGFLGGLLVFNFAAMLIYATPIWQNTVAKHIGFNDEARQATVSYVAGYCNFVSFFVADENDAETPKDKIQKLLGQSQKQIQPDIENQQETATAEKPGDANKCPKKHHPDTSEKSGR